MEEQGIFAAFSEQLVRLNGTMAELFRTGNVSLFSEMNKAIAEMHRLQHDSKDSMMQSIGQECAVIYRNFDMIIAVLRTTENGEIDAGAQKALNNLLHNIDTAVVAIVTAFGLVK